MTATSTATRSDDGLSAMRADVACKLRSTCDRCTLLKVRCDKQKPRCERCKGLGSSCVYSPRRWKGRSVPKSVSFSPSTPPVESRRNPSRASRPLAAPVVPTEPWDLMTQSAQSDSFGLPTPDLDINVEFKDTPMGMGLQWDGLFSGAHGLDPAEWYPGFMDVDQGEKGERGDATNTSHRSTHDHAASSRSVPPSPAPTSATTFSHMGSSMDLTTSASSPDAGHSASSGMEDPDSSYGSAASSCQCPTLVFQLLQDMYHADPLSSYRLAVAGADGGGPAPNAPTSNGRGSDDMVKVTREAVQRMEQLLSCDYAGCGRDPTLFFLVAALSSKLLAWYRAVFALVRRQSSGSGASPEPGADEGAAAAAAAADLAFVVPIQVEGFHLDFGSEQRMKAQFLLCEVRRLGQVLDLFGARALSRMPPAPHPAASPGALPIPAVHQFLTTSHSRLVMDVKDYCVSE